jgi:hypothetical protein
MTNDSIDDCAPDFDWLMPNGKKLGDCTMAEVKRIARFLFLLADEMPRRSAAKREEG